MTWDTETILREYDADRLIRAVQGGGMALGIPAPDEWDEWVPTLFPRHVTHSFADHHIEFWEWVWSITRDNAPRPFVAIWPRGGAKSTSAELGVTAMGVRGKRFYVWYVNETQDKADKNVENIAALLESDVVSKHYPQHASRAVSKYGQSRGWRRSRLRTSGGFTVDALGLDTAARGMKVEEQRPDLIVLDDVDGKHDSPATTAKKIETITTSILPAGASNVAVLGVQNLIIPHGVFTRLADGRADFLSDRIVSGPHPAVLGLETEWVQDGAEDTRHAVIVAGTPTWAGQDISVCERMIRVMGLSAFLKECQHLVKELAEGVALKFDPVAHRCTWSDDEIREAVKVRKLRPFAGIDFGHWRFAWILLASDEQGRIHVLDELFSQREDLTARATEIARRCEDYGIDRLIMYGDSANPTDIVEINAAWKRLGKKFACGAVAAENKARAASVERLNDLFGRLALLVRVGLASRQRWNMGMSASGEGSEQVGSRLIWEMAEWSYPGPKLGEAQDQSPEDDTADGADAVAALRYGVMSWLRAAKPKVDPPKKDRNVDKGLEKVLKRLNSKRRERW